MSDLVADSEDGKGSWAKECGQPPEVGKQKEMGLSLEPPEAMQLPTPSF